MINLLIWKSGNLGIELPPITKLRDSQITRLPDSQIPKCNERGVTVVALMFSAGIVMGIVAAGILAVSYTAQHQVSKEKWSTESRSLQWGHVAMGAALLSQRLQNPTPLTAAELQGGVLPGVPMEDEGGKISLPMNVHLLSSVAKAYGVEEMEQSLSDLAEIWRLPFVSTPYLSYPMLGPSTTPVSYIRFESPGDLAGFLGFSGGNAEKTWRWFTPCETTGVNVNTADRSCVEGVLAWQRAAAKGWTDLAADANTAEGHIQIWPLPSQEPIVKVFPPEKPEDALRTVLPVSLMAWDPAPGRGYDSLWQLVRVAISSAPFQVPWMDTKHPHQWATFDSGAVKLDKKYSTIPSYAPRQNAWLKFRSVEDADSAIGGRPYAVQEITQPLGLFWFTPESYFTPINPSALGQFEVQNPLPPIALNAGLSAAAFTGWVSLQGPGPYRAASDWFTISSRGSVGGSEVVTRWTVRIFPDEMPTVLMASTEEE